MDVLARCSIAAGGCQEGDFLSSCQRWLPHHCHGCEREHLWSIHGVRFLRILHYQRPCACSARSAGEVGHQARLDDYLPRHDRIPTHRGWHLQEGLAWWPCWPRRLLLRMLFDKSNLNTILDTSRVYSIIVHFSHVVCHMALHDYQMKMQPSTCL